MSSETTASFPDVLILDGSLGAPAGNTSRVLDSLEKALERAGAGSVERIALREAFELDMHSWKEKIRKADALVFATGTYWDSWGSPMQKFLEIMTPLEGKDEWLGKPAAVVVTMHSVGGKGILSRLQGVLNTLGLLIPPMSGVVISLAARLALSSSAEGAGREFSEDFWSEGDFEIVAHNLLESARGGRAWRAWGVDRKDPARLWTEIGTEMGPDAGSETRI